MRIPERIVSCGSDGGFIAMLKQAYKEFNLLNRRINGRKQGIVVFFFRPRHWCCRWHDLSPRKRAPRHATDSSPCVSKAAITCGAAETNLADGARGLIEKGKSVVNRQKEQLNSALEAGRQAYRDMSAGGARDRDNRHRITFRRNLTRQDGTRLT